jgi:hypothetical protein
MMGRHIFVFAKIARKMETCKKSAKSINVNIPHVAVAAEKIHLTIRWAVV